MSTWRANDANARAAQSQYTSDPASPSVFIDPYPRRRRPITRRPTAPQQTPATFPVAEFLEGDSTTEPSYADFLIPKEPRMTTPHPNVALSWPVTANTIAPLPPTEQIDMGVVLADRD